MTSPLAYALWLAMETTPRAEIMRGLLSGDIKPGALDDPDMKPGQPLRAAGYGEDRSLYTQKLFAKPGEEPRTLHLGLDIFAAAGMHVTTPLHGRVHSFRDNAQPGDYGPTIILEHEPLPGVVFHTLYGHLSRASLEGLSEGQALAAGSPLGRLGAREENGGWAPHLHFQIILDIGPDTLLGRGDYPGVCKRSESALWLSGCPDPRPFLGMAVEEEG